MMRTEDFKEGNKVINIVSFVIATTFAWWVVSTIKEMPTKHKEKEYVHQLAEDTHTDNNIHACVASNTDYEGVGEWTNHNGDIKACRKDLLHRLQVIYGDKDYERSPDRIEAEIKGDVLILYSISFRNYGYRLVMSERMWQMFVDCGFSEVHVYEGNFGGAEGFMVYAPWMEKPDLSGIRKMIDE